MSWRILWTPRALKDLRKLDRQNQARVLAGLDRLAESGEGDALQLSDVKPPEWRLRVGDWRLRFQKDPSANTIVVLRVLPRDKAY